MSIFKSIKCAKYILESLELVLRRFGVEAVIRPPSLAFYNLCQDVDALVAALYRIHTT